MKRSTIISYIISLTLLASFSAACLYWANEIDKTNERMNYENAYSFTETTQDLEALRKLLLAELSSSEKDKQLIIKVMKYTGYISLLYTLLFSGMLWRTNRNLTSR